MDEKPVNAVELISEEPIVVDDGIPETGVKAGTVEDREAMRRLGKKQLFKRNFGFVSIFGFALILSCTWEALLGTVVFGLRNGGPSGLLYTYLGVYFGFGLVSTSMAEMASMAPTSGGQYHWVSEFASRKYQKQLSYLIGWLCLLGYQVGVTIGAFVNGTIIQGLLVLNYPNYNYQRWHGTLIAMLLTFLVALFNSFLSNFLPLIEILILILHFTAWIGIMVPLWVLAPRTPSERVWKSFVDAGWENIGLACLIGMITNVGAFLGGDAPVHMAEEVRNAPKTLPRVMLWTVTINGAMGFIMLVTFCYTVGDVEAAITTPTGYPIIQVFYGATGSVASTTGLCCLLIILNLANNLTNMAGASRQMFAFARDRGMPFSSWVSRISPGYDVPVNAVIVSALCACVLHCINIGSSIAFNIILSAGSVALITSYMVSIGCVTWRRLKGLPLLESKFSLGKMGLPVNLLALSFMLLVYVFAFFPPVPHPVASGMNWAIVVYIGVLGIAGIYYVVRARHHYEGPVAYVRKSV
ncbi:amino acid/polyamine transporter I [Dendryphion nanum]|uniref:Amino acid/polyamine transporter I n=1 Tax=Dendryphion nanum TaxID=256645 RepID=A0A9P9D5E5_9PLEO|nr:amino acid/polyamine transporter I [Dendryphion nanum]